MTNIKAIQNSARTNALLCFVIFLYGLRFRKSVIPTNLLYFIIYVGLITGVIYFGENIIELKAVSRIFSDAMSSQMRFDLWSSVFENRTTFSLMFGEGVGKSATLSNAFGMPYMHNIFLELMYEFGFFSIGFIYFLIRGLIKATYHLYSKTNEFKVFISLLLIIETIQFSKSFDGTQLWSLIVIYSIFWKK